MTSTIRYPADSVLYQPDSGNALTVAEQLDIVSALLTAYNNLLATYSNVVLGLFVQSFEFTCDDSNAQIPAFVVPDGKIAIVTGGTLRNSSGDFSVNDTITLKWTNGSLLITFNALDGSTKKETLRSSLTFSGGSAGDTLELQLGDQEISETVLVDVYGYLIDAP